MLSPYLSSNGSVTLLHTGTGVFPDSLYDTCLIVCVEVYTMIFRYFRIPVTLPNHRGKDISVRSCQVVTRTYVRIIDVSKNKTSRNKMFLKNGRMDEKCLTDSRTSKVNSIKSLENFTRRRVLNRLLLNIRLWLGVTRGYGGAAWTFVSNPTSDSFPVFKTPAKQRSYQFKFVQFCFALVTFYKVCIIREFFILSTKGSLQGIERVRNIRVVKFLKCQIGRNTGTGDDVRTVSHLVVIYKLLIGYCTSRYPD